MVKNLHCLRLVLFELRNCYVQLGSGFLEVVKNSDFGLVL